MSAVTLGNVGIAVSVAVLLAAGPRLLGAGPFVALSLAWTVTTVFGYGIAMPTEQLIMRRRSARDTQASARPVVLLGLAGLLSVVALPFVGGQMLEVGEATVAVPTAAAGIAGWVLLATARGRVGGAGRLHAYAGLLGLEAATRIVLVVGAVAFPSGSTWLLGSAVGVPVVVSALVGLTLQPIQVRRHAAVLGLRGLSGPGESEQAAFVLVAVGYQLCLNAAPLVLAWRADAASHAAIGAFVITSSYYRVAAVLGAGYATHTLVTLSSLWSGGSYGQFKRGLRRGVISATAVTVAATAGAGALGPIAVPLLNGRDPKIPLVVLTGLAVSTVLATAAAVATTGLMASQRGSAAAGWWLAGAAVHLLILVTTTSIGGTVALALVAGPAIVLAGVLATARRLPESSRPLGLPLDR
ncbi:hypothetical protein [Pedococcus bigeumensis]|uniref:hypothetical protein n=1 Tax=Pedococcus bigeumensis TaxID=433644 RepID=UPI0031E146F7